MTKNFTICTAVSNKTSLSPEEKDNNDFFAELFASNWEIMGFQIVSLVMIFVIILPLTLFLIEVIK